MQVFEQLGKSSGSKLLPFRAPTPGIQLDGKPNLDQLAHDVASLPRPVPVEMTRAPRLAEADGLAHDARTLLTSLQVFSDLLAEPGVLAEGQSQYARDLKLLGGSLSSLVERLASGPATRTGEPIFTREPLRPRLPSIPRSISADRQASTLAQLEGRRDAGAMVKSCEQLLAAIAGPSVALHISFERGLGVLALQGEELTRVLINLVKNASEAMRSNGRIAITVRRALGATPAVLISVEDNGAGIPAHAMGQIFQAGFTSKKSGQRWPASAHHGLGLTIVRELVEGAGGTIRVTSALKKGTRFELRVPCQRG